MMSKESKFCQPRVAPVPPRRWRRRLGGVPFKPTGHVVVIKLLAPQHPGEGLAHHQGLVSRGASRGQLAIELVGFGPAGGHNLVEIAARALPVRRALRSSGAQAQVQVDSIAGLDGDLVPEGALGAPQLRVDRRRARDDVVVDPVLGVGRARRHAIEPRLVGLVLTEQQRRRRPARGRPPDQLELAEERVADPDRSRAVRRQLRLGSVEIPRPGVAEPGSGQHVQRVRLGAGVGDLDRHQDVVGAGLGVVGLDHPVAVLVESAGVEQLVLGVPLPAPAVLLS